MAESVRDPGEDVENRMGVGGQNVGEVGTVKDVLEGGEDANPDVGAVFRINEADVQLASKLGD